MNLPGYPKYKPSGVEWLGDVPEHWAVIAFRYLITASNAGEVIDRSFWHEGEELLFSCQRESMKSDFPAFPSRKRTSGNDLLVTRNGTPYVHLPPTNSIYTNVVQRCALNDRNHRRFIATALEAGCGSLRGIGYGVSIPSFSFEKWSDLKIPIPPEPEQRKVADFLDERTGKLDALAEKKRALIEKLKEKRRALISRTVTKGLPVEAAAQAGLPIHPKLKPSGIDWLGDISEHWEVKPLRRIVQRIEQGWSPECSNVVASLDEWGVVKAGCCNGGRFNPQENKALPSDLDPPLTLEIESGDFLMSRASGSEELVGSVAIVPAGVRKRLLLSDKTYRLTITEAVAVSPFVVRLLQSPVGRLQIQAVINGASGLAKNIAQSDVKNLVFALPPLPEQTAIADYLHRETAKIDGMIEKVEAALENLAEYRTALITAAVTGKIDVRGAMA